MHSSTFPDSTPAPVSIGLPTAPAEWDAFVDRAAGASIYCKTWWLDAVCPAAYELIAIRRDGVIRAGMALPIERRRGRVSVTMPPLTQSLGPLLWLPPGQKYGTQLTYEMKILRELIASIPPADDFFVNCGPHFTNWLPFHWAGYTQTTRYTYELDDLTDLQSIRDGMSDKTRNIIRKAEKAGIRIEECNDLESLMPLLEMTYTRQSMEFPHDPELIRRLDRAAVANASRKIFVAKDASGRMHAGIYLVHTPQRTYYVMQGSDPALRASGAPLLLHWHAIQFASTVSRSYDFVGSMMENVERVFRSFGAVQKPYFSIIKSRPPASSLRGLADRCRRLIHRSFAAVTTFVMLHGPEALLVEAADALAIVA